MEIDAPIRARSAESRAGGFSASGAGAGPLILLFLLTLSALALRAVGIGSLLLVLVEHDADMVGQASCLAEGRALSLSELHARSRALARYRLNGSSLIQW